VRGSRRWAGIPPRCRTDEVRALVAERARRFIEEAPTSAAEAATIILDGVKADRWRILVGADADLIDELVRQSPEQAYDADFFESFAAIGRMASGPLMLTSGVAVEISNRAGP